MNKLRLNQYILLLLALLVGCQNEREFEWSEDLKQTIGNDLEAWLEKSPFNGQWNETEPNSDRIVFDNRNQVFPFLGKFKDENDDFKDKNASESDVYQNSVLLFKDDQFGECFVYASLLYDPKELFLENSYSERGNAVFSGQNAINESYYASLSETMISNQHDGYKTTIYQVTSNYKVYLFGFYQKGKLVFQFGFPYDINTPSKGLQKIKEINRALNLNVKEWADATEEKLEINNDPQSFWKNPFQGIYLGQYGLPDLNIKIRNTDFKKLKSRLSKEKNVDYLFAYEDSNQKHTISFKRETTNLNQLQYEDEHQEVTHIPIDDLSKRKLFITSQKTTDGQVTMNTETYFKNNSILKIQASYPEKNAKAKEEVFDILTNLRIRNF